MTSIPEPEKERLRLRAYRGKGYAMKSAWAMLAFAFAQHGVPEVNGLIRSGNEASIRVAERLPAEQRGRSPVEGWEALVYGVTRRRFND